METNWLQRYLHDRRWNAAVDFGSPMSAWSSEMFRIARATEDPIERLHLLGRSKSAGWQTNRHDCDGVCRSIQQPKDRGDDSDLDPA